MALSPPSSHGVSLGGVATVATPAAATQVLTATGPTTADWEAVAGTSVSSGAAASGAVLTAQGSGNSAFNRQGLDLIASGVLAGTSVNLFDVSAISGAYQSLLIHYMGRSNNASATVNQQLRLNADAGANYDQVDWFVNGAAPTTGGGTQTGQTSALGNTTIVANSATAGSCSTYTVFLPFYSGTTFWKLGEVMGSSESGAATYTWYHNVFRWKSTAAITRVTLAGLAGSFMIGSSYAIWGLK